MIKEILIKNKIIGSNNSPFILAKMPGNHNQSLERALEIVAEVAKTNNKKKNRN